MHHSPGLEFDLNASWGGMKTYHLLLFIWVYIYIYIIVGLDGLAGARFILFFTVLSQLMYLKPSF